MSTKKKPSPKAVRRAEALPATPARPARWPWVLLGVIILFVAVIRIRLLQTPLERDEGEFAYMGQLMLQGVPPYLMAYNMKLPGIYAAYALVMALFGQTIAGIHVGLLLVNAAAIVLQFLVTRRLFGNIAAVVSAAGYGLLSLSPSVQGTSAHATQFIVPLMLGGTLLLLRALDSAKNRVLFAGGLCYGMAFLMKQHAIFFMAFAVAYFLWITISERPLNAKRLAAGVSSLLIGCAIPLAATCAALYAAGVFKNFWFWIFSYGSQYVSMATASDAVRNFARLASLQIIYLKWILIMAGIGVTSIFWNKRAQSQWPFLAGMTLFSFLTICPGFYFRAHYFVTMLPILAILAGVATNSATQFFSERKSLSSVKSLPVIATIVFLICSVVIMRFYFFKATPAQASRSLYGLSPFPESLEIAAYIKNHTTKDDRIAVLGSEPQICFYADRKSATGYIYMYPLMEPQPFASKMQQDMIHDIEKTRPKYVVYVDVASSWVQTSESDTTIFRWAQTYIGGHYRIAGFIEMLPDGNYQSVWNDASRNSLSVSTEKLYVFERLGS
jgi:4-amino-4-deoxy-L-arabinose transferase-like glycosyltransferase